jgi:hypothetical protein
MEQERLFPYRKRISTLLYCSKKKAWYDFFKGIRTVEEKLPDEFDKIIEKGISFNAVDFS